MSASSFGTNFAAGGGSEFFCDILSRNLGILEITGRDTPAGGAHLAAALTHSPEWMRPEHTSKSTPAQRATPRIALPASFKFIRSATHARRERRW